MIEKLAAEASIAELCSLFNAARSGYYAWKKRGLGKRRKENALLKEEIRGIHKESDENYGSPRITPELKNKGYRCGHNRVARLIGVGDKRCLKTQIQAQDDRQQTCLTGKP
ncbi:MAG: IS3 family transposase [Candidatus Omnitrophica bacterium]|nr:IS3 family transposase [Candidatus Omnitrophota bacterium]